MKRLLNTSKTFRSRWTRNAKSCETRSGNGKKWSGERLRFEVTKNQNRSMSTSRVEVKDDSGKKVLKREPKIQDSLRVYWNLDQEQKRKFADPVYIKQAIHETFMQRAHGAYRYTRPLTFPQHTSVSHKTTFAGNQRTKIGHDNIAKPVKTLPFAVDVNFPKPRLTEKKKLVGKAIRKASAQTEKSLERSFEGFGQKDLSLAQLEAARKKLNDAPDRKLGTRVSKCSARQTKMRKEKYKADTKEPERPPIGSRIDRQEKKLAVPDNIAITPRTIGIKKMTDVPHKSKDMNSDVLEEVGKWRSGRALVKTSLKAIKQFEKKKPPPTIEKSGKTKHQSKEDRQMILSSMKSAKAASTKVVPPANPRRRMKKDLELTPQIYPKSSLSLKKSYLPITACRSVAVRKTGPGTKICASSAAAKDLMSVRDAERKLVNREEERRSITAHIVESIKSLIGKIRPSSMR